MVSEVDSASWARRSLSHNEIARLCRVALFALGFEPDDLSDHEIYDFAKAFHGFSGLESEREVARWAQGVSRQRSSGGLESGKKPLDSEVSGLLPDPLPPPADPLPYTLPEMTGDLATAPSEPPHGTINEEDDSEDSPPPRS